ncbi:TPA: DUF1654 domain-containing protein [Pseudomonas putida]|uniref:DUF1654 domain-containing protein n=1 Tax=Pseudomonas putida TaxID=303 RepID=UPI000A902B14|nr:DUF1654 domain-containing protein [Pseudomonas putida]MDD2116724.1 DUF1654 domain-containing protein [Pseudomonas putida]UPU94046.1 DUF1654 domain-containing protein [Pseudomonas putida]HDS1728238.1 DUF1654 domain-containing protein [Pseudomonas putida]
MAKQNKTAPTQKRQGMTALERLGLRMSNMINHPKAQEQRWVAIHRLDTDGDAEWGEMMRLLGETDGLEITHLEEGGIKIEWEMQSDEDREAPVDELEALEEEAPF